jgi:hypothetical protein
MYGELQFANLKYKKWKGQHMRTHVSNIYQINLSEAALKLMLEFKSRFYLSKIYNKLCTDMEGAYMYIFKQYMYTPETLKFK